MAETAATVMTAAVRLSGLPAIDRSAGLDSVAVAVTAGKQPGNKATSPVARKAVLRRITASLSALSQHAHEAQVEAGLALPDVQDVGASRSGSRSPMANPTLLELELEVLDVKVEVEIKTVRGLVSAVGLALMGAAVAQELRKPAGERAWHGRLWGRVPYEFRPPTLDRIRHAYWAPDDARAFTDTAFGVGWSVNLGRLLHACSTSCLKVRSSEVHQVAQEGVP